MRVPLVLATLALAAAPRSADAPRYQLADVPAELLPTLARAEGAIRAAACDAEREFGEGDPDANAARCEGAREVGGVEVGRTSARLRNPRNAPPAWAVAYVASTDGRKAAAVAPVAFDLGDSVGLLKPIEIRRRCLACHAARERIAPDTRDWLQRAYPQDRSFGYALGDLRGFWWADGGEETTVRTNWHYQCADGLG